MPRQTDIEELIAKAEAGEFLTPRDVQRVIKNAALHACKNSVLADDSSEPVPADVQRAMAEPWVKQNERTPEEIALRWLLDTGVRRTVDGEYHDDTGCKVYAPDEVEDTIQNMGYLGKQRHMWHRVRVKWADQFDIHATPGDAMQDAETQVLEQLRARVHNNDLIGYEFTITLID